MTASAEPERALLVGEDCADVGKVETVGWVEDLPAIAAPACYAGAGLSKDAAFAIFGNGEDAGACEGGYVLWGNVPDDERSAPRSQNAEVPSAPDPQPALMVPVDKLPGLPGYSLLLTQDFDLIVLHAAELLSAAQPECAVMIGEDVMQM